MDHSQSPNAPSTCRKFLRRASPARPTPTATQGRSGANWATLTTTRRAGAPGAGPFCQGANQAVDVTAASSRETELYLRGAHTCTMPRFSSAAMRPGEYRRTH